MKLLIFSIACSFLMVSLSDGTSSLCDHPDLPVRAASLGGWLVTEGYIKPSLFQGIVNKDLLDGTGVNLRSLKEGKHLSIDNKTGLIVASTTTPASLFLLWRINETSFNLRSPQSKRFMGLGKNGELVVAAKTPTCSETFVIHRNPCNQNLIRIKAPNGFFLQVGKLGKVVSADYEKNCTTFEDNDPSVFFINITKIVLAGEYQVTNGYGPRGAKSDDGMQEHWSTFIVEKDFKFVKKKGLNSVRIPVGWWIAYDPNPPKPFVGGSLHFLDKAFSWVEKYGLKVIVDLHCVPGSQNGWEHSGTRDGIQEWGQTQDSINQALHVIDFLVARYAKRPSLLAIELLNEPRGPAASQKIMSEFYKAGYDVVRKHSATAYVILSNRFEPGTVVDPREFFHVAKDMKRSVIDVHYYQVYDEMYRNFTVDQNIDFINTNRTDCLRRLLNGPLVFVGEWTTEMLVKNATKEDYQRYAKAQQQVYGTASFGWAHWSFKNYNQHWSLEWMINNGYIVV